MRHMTGIEAMKAVAVLTAGKFNRDFYYYSPAEGRRHPAEPNDIAWNVLNWVSHTGIEALQVWVSADGTVFDIEMWEDDSRDESHSAPEVTYVVVVDK